MKNDWLYTLIVSLYCTLMFGSTCLTLPTGPSLALMGGGAASPTQR